MSYTIRIPFFIFYKILSVLQNRESLHAQRMSVYDELEDMGLGLNELRLLRNTIGEIAAENNIGSTMAVELEVLLPWFIKEIHAQISVMPQD